MASIETRPTKIGNLVKKEFWIDNGYCRSPETLLLTGNAEIGMVYETDGDGTYSEVTAAKVATLDADIVVLIDDAVYGAGTGDTLLNTLKRGPVTIVREQLKFGDVLSGGQVDTVVAALEALGFQVGTQV
jgi:hypothetical protein